MSAPVRIDPEILRAYDIRGRIETQLTADVMRALGAAFGAEMRERGAVRVAVGYDGRLSSPALEAALVEGLVSAGAHVLRVGLGPSPMLYFAVHHLSADAGLMVTGSHNPPDYNGLKMTLGGHAFFGDDIRRLAARVAAGDTPRGAGTVVEAPVGDAYIDRLVRDFPDGKPLRVAWDPGNGAAADCVRALCARLPGTHAAINDTVDGRFPAHHPDPTVEANLAQLKDLVRREDCDLGLGFDGDGDRIGVIDRHGRVLWGDQLLILLAREVLTAHPGARILTEVKASRVFFDEIRRLGGEPVMWKSGHSHIKEKMAEIGAPLAGEMSAHIFFKHRYYGFDDALYAAVRLLALLAVADDDLAAMMDALPKTHATPEIRFACADDEKFAVVERVAASLRGQGAEVIDIDGVRVEKPEGWWLLRASNTQPVLVVRCEAESARGLRALVREVRAELTAAGVAVPDF